MDGRDDTDAHAEHHSQSVDKHHNRSDEVDGRQSLRTDAVPDEDAVGDDEGHIENHTQQGGEEELAKKFADFLVAEIYTVAIVFHSFFTV